MAKGVEKLCERVPGWKVGLGAARLIYDGQRVA